jgi:nucleotide-binding universal stress UspA family protein
MLVDLHILLRGPAALIVAGTLTVVAFGGKWLAAFFTQKLFRFSGIQRRVIFGLTSAHAAATLAVILIGFNIGIVNESVLNGTVILILITCLVSSFITESAGRELAVQEQDQLPESETQKERILVPISNPGTIEQLMDFAVMLRDIRQKEPVYALTVVKDDEEAVRKVKLSSRMLESVIKHASATDTEVEIRARVDLSVASGITRAAKEINATDLILGWSPKGRTADRLFGSKLANILENVWQTVYVCHFVHPLNTNRKMVVALPPYVQYEAGFSRLVWKIRALATEMGVNITVGCAAKTAKVFAREMEKHKSSVTVQFISVESPEEMPALLAHIGADDLFIMANARRGTVSYDPYMDTLIIRINKTLRGNNFMLVYPEQHAVVVKETGLQPQDINLAPIQEQIENLSRIGKALRRIFRRQQGTGPQPEPQREPLGGEQWEDDVEEGMEEDGS